MGVRLASHRRVWFYQPNISSTVLFERSASGICAARCATWGTQNISDMTTTSAPLNVGYVACFLAIFNQRGGRAIRYCGAKKQPKQKTKKNLRSTANG